jgi:DNA modification methylase
MNNNIKEKLQMKTVEVKISDITLPQWNPRQIDDDGFKTLCKSIKEDPEFLRARPVILSDRTGTLVAVAGNQRIRAATHLEMETVPAIVVTLTEEMEKTWALKDNLHQGGWDWGMLAEGFEESFLENAGFTSEDLDKIFEAEENHEIFDLQAELKKLDIASIDIKPGDCFDLDGSRAMCGDSTIEADILKLMGDEKADMVLTDPPYILSYNSGGKRHGDTTQGFGYKRNRTYLGTEELPENFSDLWMDAVAKVQKPDFSIIVFENPKNLRTIWNALEKHWRYRNTITWFVSNRMQGFSAKYKFFNKTDIAIVGTGGNVALNLDDEDELLEQEYENAIFATSGKPHWENYEKGKKICPTDFIEHPADDAKHSGQNIIFGTKPLPLLIPYIKVLTKRGDLILEPFCGSGSTLCAATKMNRRCFTMEKSPVYLTVALRRWSKLTGKQPIKIN